MTTDEASEVRRRGRGITQVVDLPDGPADIDIGIADLVRELNAAGFRTAFCCSGLKEDHPDRSDSHNVRGYIMFVGLDAEQALRVQLAANRIQGLFSDRQNEIMGCWCWTMHLQPWRDDCRMRADWAVFRARLLG